MESFKTIAELSKNAKQSVGTSNIAVLYSCSEIPVRIKKLFKNNYIPVLFLKPVKNCRTL